MIFDIYTATAIPGRVPDVQARVGEALESRAALSPLGGAWRSELGVLMQVVHLWPYRDHAERTAVMSELDSLSGWPVQVDDVLADERLETWTSAPFADRLLEAGSYGGVYEMRTYSFRPGTMDQVLEVWEKALPVRVEMSPLVAIMTSESGALNRLRHIWVYQDLNERARIREESLSRPPWPPLTREWRFHEETQILLPETFSPLQ
jgi:hypothetical protein